MTKYNIKINKVIRDDMQSFLEEENVKSFFLSRNKTILEQNVTERYTDFLDEKISKTSFWFIERDLEPDFLHIAFWFKFKFELQDEIQSTLRV